MEQGVQYLTENYRENLRFSPRVGDRIVTEVSVKQTLNLRTSGTDESLCELIKRRQVTVLLYNKQEENEKRWKLGRLEYWDVD